VVGLPGKLQAIPEGSGVLHDEESVLAGEGARTEEALFQNLEEQMRASQKHLVVCSPERHEHGTMQAAFEALMVHPERKFTLFMVWVGDYPMGVVAFPWMRTELYEVYKPWKYDNVQRALKGVFRDNTYLIRMAMRVFEDDQFVEYFEAATNKPKKTDFAHAIELFKPQMMTHSQVDKVVSMMFNLAANYKRLAPNLERWFGVKPNEGLKRVADKCSK
jgi:hypothetical protein